MQIMYGMWSLLWRKLVSENEAEWRNCPHEIDDLFVQLPPPPPYREIVRMMPPLDYDPVFNEFKVLPPAKTYGFPLQPLIHGVFTVGLAAYSLRQLLMMERWKLMPRFTSLMFNPAEPIHDYHRFREAFTKMEWFSVTPFNNHSHGAVAAARKAANDFISAFCVKVGLKRWSFQTSASEQKHGVDGYRSYVWTKDTQQELMDTPLTPGHLISMVDVDYYVDMPEFLARQTVPVLLYTATPVTAGATRNEYMYSWNPDSSINWIVSGGATYRHQLWDYSVDNFVVYETRLGLPYHAVLYDVQTRNIGDDRSIILLSPIRHFYGLSALLAMWRGNALCRRVVARHGFAKVVTFDGKKRNVSIGRLNTPSSTTLPGDAFDSLVTITNISPLSKINNYQTKSILSTIDPESKLGQRDIIAPILTDFLLSKANQDVTLLHIREMPRMTQFAFETPEPTDKAVMEAFAKPFVPPAFVPMKNKDCSDQSIRGRVLLPKEQAAEMLGTYVPTKYKQLAMQGFVERLVPVPHAGVPYDYLQVAEKQTKPGQKKDLADAGVLGVPKPIVKTFMKSEAYGKPTDPRNITTFDPVQKIGYAHYMYALMDHVKQFPFYAFGCTPKTVAHKVAAVCAISESIECADISRMDGFVNVFCRELELSVGLRFFNPSEHNGFAQAHRSSFNNVGVTTYGMRYDQEESRGSGEMGTSVWNTIITCFMLYYARFLQNGHDHDAAWQYLLEKVLAGGDDSIAGDMPGDLLIRAGRDIGFIVKSVAFARGDTGVNFLARIYGPMVWNGNPNSMCSLKRQMEKFHLTPSLPLSPKQKAYEKALSFSYTDYNTPIIGDLVRAILKACGGYTTTGLLKRYGDDVDKEEQYPNDAEPWMMDVADSELPGYNLADFVTWCASSPTIESLLDAPVFYPTGREYTYDEWDPEPGLLIKRTRTVLLGKKKKDKPTPSGPTPVKKADDSKSV